MAEEQQKEGSIFRQASMDRVASPEQTDEYIRLPSMSVGFFCTAVLLLVIGAVVWISAGGL